MTEATVFDLDGTLVDLPIDYERLFEEFRRIMRKNDVRPIVDTVSRLNSVTKEAVFAAWERAELAAADKTATNEVGMKIYKAHANKPKALVTRQGKAVTDVILKQTGLAFDIVVTREDTLIRTDQLRRAIQQLGAEVRNVLFVGNTKNDASAARTVGCQFQRVKLL
jgi:HAD superfamily hydrolase (TIGR01549 family)